MPGPSKVLHFEDVRSSLLTPCCQLHARYKRLRRCQNSWGKCASGSKRLFELYKSTCAPLCWLHALAKVSLSVSMEPGIRPQQSWHMPNKSMPGATQRKARQCSVKHAAEVSAACAQTRGSSKGEPSDKKLRCLGKGIRAHLAARICVLEVWSAIAGLLCQLGGCARKCAMSAPACAQLHARTPEWLQDGMN